MRKLFVLMAVISSVFFINCKAMAIGLEAAIGYFNQSPSGTVAYKPVTGSDSLDLEKDMGYDSEWQLTGRLKIDVPVLPNIYLMATPMQFDGKGKKNVNFKFGDETFNASVDFISEVQLDHYDVALYYGIPFLSMATLGRINAEVGLNLRVIDFSATVEQPSLNRSESVSETIPVPMLYAGVQIKPVGFLAIEAEGRGIAYNSHSYYDIIGRVKVKPVPLFFIAGGYRYEKIKIDDISDIFTDLEFSGPFVEAGIEF